ncbi:MAG: hypothetical protein ACR2HS_02280, partial [Gammaproteobacteria bacterium]
LILTGFILIYLPLDSSWLEWKIVYKIFKLSEILFLGLIIYIGTLWFCGFRLKNILVSGDYQ